MLMIIIVKYLCDKMISLSLSLLLYIFYLALFFFSLSFFLSFSVPLVYIITYYLPITYYLLRNLCVHSLSPSFFFVIHFMYFFPAITMYTFYFFSCPFSLKKNITGTQTKKNHMYMLRSYHTHTHITLAPTLFFF
ncbi:hypothetical protein EDC94DRAFT_622107 [Helicostylum pulchrum]|nr:hypothetical protein EDC94DRAFT_622107 [Helicostylum pulchrum]